MRHCLEKNSKEGVREGSMYLLNHYGMLRGHHAREAELPDLQQVELKNEGFSRCLTMLLYMDHTKTTQKGERKEMAGMMRARDWTVCPLFWMSFQLFTLSASLLLDDLFTVK